MKAALRAIDKPRRERELSHVMQKHARRAKKRLDYPDETNGSRLAAKARKLASRHTPEERRAHLDAAMAIIYGANPTEKALPRR